MTNTARAPAPRFPAAIGRGDPQGFPIRTPGYSSGMTLPIVLIIIGIVLAILVSWVLGVIVILIGLALLLVPRLGGASRV